MSEEPRPIVLERASPDQVFPVKSFSTDYGEWAAFFITEKLRVLDQANMGPASERPALPEPDYEPVARIGTPEQQAAFRALAAGHNVCILGPGGTGKSQLIHWVRDAFLIQNHSVVVTASTANAAYLLGGRTLHRFAGLPITVCDEHKCNVIEAFDRYYKHVRRLLGVINNICFTHLWICDEISMLSPRVFILVDLMFRFYRRQPDKPFGGCQFLWSGDFLQIPPVEQGPRVGTKRRDAQGSQSRGESSTFLFTHDAWYTGWRPHIVQFSTNKRSKAHEWSALLARVRMSEPTDDDIRALNERRLGALKFRGEAHAFFDDVVTHIYPTNADVKRENDMARERLFGSDHVFDSGFQVTSNLLGDWTEDDSYFYAQWCHNGGPVPREWVPRLNNSQFLCLPNSPWYLVLARSIKLEHGYFSHKKPATDDECKQALVEAALSFLRENRIPERQMFRLGEKVRMTVNLAQSIGLVNGTTGHIVGFCVQDPDAIARAQWQDTSLRQLKRFLNASFSVWYSGESASIGGVDIVDDEDMWVKALEVSAPPRTYAQLMAMRDSPAVLLDAATHETPLSEEMSALAKIRACWYGSVAVAPWEDLQPGDFIWTDEIDVA